MYKINKNTSGIACFVLVTICYLVIYYLTFKGFNGSDDLHYAKLASNMLKGKYNPFEPNDIFAGRALLISWQAFIYYIGGINTFTTQIGTLVALVLSCYLTIFKIAKFKNWQPVLGCAVFFYFNPIVNTAVLGILPDVYIMLLGILLLMLWINIKQEENKKKAIIKVFFFGVVSFLGLFIKENALIFIPFLFIISLLDNRRKNSMAMIAIATFLICIFFSGIVYYHYTGDFYLRLHQILNSSSNNACNYDTQSVGAFIKRITYGVWENFITEGFYPVIFAALLLIIKFFKTKYFKIEVTDIEKMFIILLLLGLYFPFSLKGYQPLCFKCRHFIFLLPLAAVLCVSYIEETVERKHFHSTYIYVSALIFCVSVISTGNKWYWMIYLLLLLFFTLFKIKTSTLLIQAKYFILSFILSLFIFYKVVYYKSNWYQNLKSISSKVDGQSFYFPDHDNMLHFQLLHGFDKKYNYYNLQVKPYNIYAMYYDKLDSTNFKAGWLIVNNAYTEASPKFHAVSDSLKLNNYFKKQIAVGDVDAFYIDSKETLEYLKNAIKKN